MIFKGFIVTKMLSTHTHVHTSFSVSVSVYDYEFLSLSISLSLSLPVRMWVCVCVCVCVCVPEWIYGWNAPVNGGLPCKQRPYSVVCQFGANRVGEGGGALTWYFTSFIYMKIIQYCSTLIGVSKIQHKQCCFFIIWSRGSPRRIYAEM